MNVETIDAMIVIRIQMKTTIMDAHQIIIQILNHHLEINHGKIILQKKEIINPIFFSSVMPRRIIPTDDDSNKVRE
jgi:hypothetical protein